MKVKNYLTLMVIMLGLDIHAQTGDTFVCENVCLKTTFSDNSSKIVTYNEIIKGRSFYIQNESRTFYDVKQSLQDDEIAIETFACPQANGRVEYVAFVVRNTYYSPIVFHLFYEDEIKRKVGKGEKIFADVSVASMLLKPIGKELEGIRKIYFTPSGFLHQFAIEYCSVEEGVMLAEKYQFFRLTSSAVLTQRIEKRKTYSHFAIYGGIDYDVLPNYEEEYEGKAKSCRLGYLQDSYLAAIDIDKYLLEIGLHGTFYANETATEKSFKLLPGKGVQLFFIETHGVTEPKYTGLSYPNALMFAGSSYVMEGGIVPEGYEDGLLTTKEIATLDLSGIDLAVISACKSALGDIDWKGVDGLMRSFKIAGVNSLIMTTDDVVDYVSGEVWRTFFQNVVRGMSKRESLLNAIKRIRTIHDGFYSSPKFWTPFVLIDGTN